MIVFMFLETSCHGFLILLKRHFFSTKENKEDPEDTKLDVDKV
jgi:hypothetical protein